jgi:hypothetical protein
VGCPHERRSNTSVLLRRRRQIGIQAWDAITFTTEGELLIDGVIVEVDRPRKLVHTFKELWNDEGKDDWPSRVTYEIEQLGDVCKLTVVHDDFDSETATYKAVKDGWNPILSGLKTLLETGTPLNIPMREQVS